MSFWRDQSANEDLLAVTTAAIMSNGLIVFNVLDDIHLMDLNSVCMTGNDVTASTLQWQSVPTVGAAATFTGASASLASQLAGARVSVIPTSLANAPVIVASGAALGGNAAGLYIPKGTIKLVIGVGPTTGTWMHQLVYKPLNPGAIVTPAF